ncbi:MAG: ABC transporter permease [Oscillospiraceae bacterium]|jgi:ABC-type uncharacterized transport system permease subunit
MKKLQLKKTPNWLYDLWKTLFALAAAFVIGAIFLLVAGADPLSIYGAIFAKAFGSFDTTLRRATPLMLSGLAVAIPLKTGMFNMGGEGQIIAGALAAAVVGSLDLGLPTGLHAAAAIAASLLIGALLAGLPGLLKITRGANEVVTTLMLNSVAAHLVTWLVLNPFKGTDYSPQSKKILQTAEIASFGDSDASWGLLIALALCVLSWLFLYRTRLGLEMRAAGTAPLTARYQGIRNQVVGLLGMVLGGALASMGGALEVLGGQHVYFDEFFSNYGFDGIAIAYMAGGNPLGIVLTALVIAMIRVGALSVSRRTGMSPYFVTVLQGVIIILLVVPQLFDTLCADLKALTRRKASAQEGVKQ